MCSCTMIGHLRMSEGVCGKRGEIDEEHSSSPRSTVAKGLYIMYFFFLEFLVALVLLYEIRHLSNRFDLCKLDVRILKWPSCRSRV